MAKNYILKKEDAVFVGVNNDLLQYDIIDSPNICPQLSGSTLEIDGERFLYAVGDDGGVLFTRNGVEPTSQPEEDVSVSYDPEYNKVSFFALLKKYPDMQDGTQYTLPLYIYTGEDDPVDEEETGSSTGLPEMNVTYEFSETAKNDIEEIIQAIYTHIGRAEETYFAEVYPGYSPMDRLVLAVASYCGVPNIYDALTAGHYPNQLKRIAAIIRGDFGES